MKIIVQNKKAVFDYEISYKLETGIVLSGDEVKSIKAHHVSLNGSFATIKDGELFLLNCNVSTYSHAYQKQDEMSVRTRKLLVHKKELNRLIGEISQKGMTVLPLKLYINSRGLIKVELGIGKHRKAHNKKALLKERDIERDTRRELKNIQ